MAAHHRQPAPLDRLFLHYFDVHYLADLLDAGNASRETLKKECALATRLAILCANTVFVPAASYYENDICREIIDGYRDLFATGSLVIVGGSASPREFAEEKLTQYNPGSLQAASYEEVLKVTVEAPKFRPRQRSATADVSKAWMQRAQNPGFAEEMFGGSLRGKWDALADRWVNVPDLLDGNAFTPEYAQALLFPNAPLGSRRRVAGHINGSYFASYSDEFEAGYVTDLIYLEAGADLTGRFGDLPMKALREELRREGLLERVVDANAAELIALRDDPAVSMAIVAVLDARPDGAPVNRLRLDELEPDLPVLLAQMRKVRSGQKGATVYHRRVADLMTQMMRPHVGPAVIEAEINEGRKRLDILWPNIASSPFFRWLRNTHNARFIVGECKNYSADPKNPEIDQMIGRLSPTRGEIGLLLCRRVAKRDVATARSRDAFHAGHGAVIVLDDDDIATMTTLTAAGNFDDTSATGWLYKERILPII